MRIAPRCYILPVAFMNAARPVPRPNVGVLEFVTDIKRWNLE